LQLIQPGAWQRRAGLSQRLLGDRIGKEEPRDKREEGTNRMFLLFFARGPEWGGIIPWMPCKHLGRTSHWKGFALPSRPGWFDNPIGTLSSLT
jgi:hypothetical protein